MYKIDFEKIKGHDGAISYMDYRNLINFPSIDIENQFFDKIFCSSCENHINLQFISTYRLFFQPILNTDPIYGIKIVCMYCIDNKYHYEH